MNGKFEIFLELRPIEETLWDIANLYEGGFDHLLWGRVDIKLNNMSLYIYSEQGRRKWPDVIGERSGVFCDIYQYMDDFIESVSRQAVALDGREKEIIEGASTYREILQELSGDYEKDYWSDSREFYTTALNKNNEDGVILWDLNVAYRVFRIEGYMYIFWDTTSDNNSIDDNYIYPWADFKGKIVISLWDYIKSIEDQLRKLRIDYENQLQCLSSLDFSDSMRRSWEAFDEISSRCLDRGLFFHWNRLKTKLQNET